MNNSIPSFEELNSSLQRPLWLDSIEGLPESLFAIEGHGVRPIFPNRKMQLPTKKGWRMSFFEIETRLKWKLRWYQKEVLNSNAAIIVMSIGRRGGKDVTATLKVLQEAMEKKGDYYILYPTFKQAHDAIFTGRTKEGEITINKLIPTAFIRKISKAELEIELINGSKIVWRGCEHRQGKHLTGNNAAMVVFSEFATTRDGLEIYFDQIAPMLSLTKGQVIFQAAHHDDGDDFDKIKLEAERNKDALTSDGRLRYHLVVITPRDYMTREEEWELEAQYLGDRPALARHYYQKRGFYSTRETAWGDILSKVRFGTDIEDTQLPLFSYWDWGGTCNTAALFFQIQKNDLVFTNGFESRRGDSSGMVGTSFMIKEAQQIVEPFPCNLHYLPHDSDTLKSLDIYVSPMRAMKLAGMKVIMTKRTASVSDQVRSIRDFLIDYYKRKGKLPLFDEKCRFIWVHLMQYKMQHTAFGQELDKPMKSWHNDMADCFRGAISILLKDSRYKPMEMIKRFYPQYRLPKDYESNT